jgi:hypothetical protein
MLSLYVQFPLPCIANYYYVSSYFIVFRISYVNISTIPYILHAVACVCLQEAGEIKRVRLLPVERERICNLRNKSGTHSSNRKLSVS